MKSIIQSWHPVHTDARRGAHFAEFAREVKSTDVDDDRRKEAAAVRALGLLTKDTKSLSKTMVGCVRRQFVLPESLVDKLSTRA